MSSGDESFVVSSSFCLLFFPTSIVILSEDINCIGADASMAFTFLDEVFNFK